MELQMQNENRRDDGFLCQKAHHSIFQRLQEANYSQ